MDEAVLRRSWPRRSLAGVLALLALGACGDDSREIQPPEGQMDTTTTSAAPEEPAGAGDGQAPLELTTGSFTPGELVPQRYTCHGEDVSPGLSWSNVPEGTQELVIIMRDLDATVERPSGQESEFIHWVVGGIDPGAGELAEGEVPDGAVEALNDFGEEGWAGPCPPEGSGDHVYEFRVYALGEALSLVPDLEPEQSVALVEGAATQGTAAFMGTVTG